MEKKRIRIKNIILLLFLLLIVALLLALPRMAGKAAEEEFPVSILSAQVQRRTIRRVLSGGGPLSAGKETDVTVPDGVTLTELFISNGDTVQEGDIIASVDRISVMAAVTRVQASLDILKRQMDSLKTTAGTITTDGDENYYLNGKKIKTEDLSDHAEYVTLVRQHREYEEIMQRLMTLYDQGLVISPIAGLVHGIDKGALLKPEKGDLSGEASQNALYNTETTLLCSIVPQEKMSFIIRIDERDIPFVSVGMPAEVTVDALPGQFFSGTVTEIGQTGQSEGGSSKFDVKIELPYSSDMLPNMNAGASLTLETFENVLTVPVAALEDRGQESVVYTGYDAEHDLLLHPVRVLPGVSDGEFAEISGELSEGSPIWYAYYDKLPLA